MKILIQEIGNHDYASLISGFKVTGIFPMDRQHVLKRLPDSADCHEAAKEIVSNAVLDHLCATHCPKKSIPTWQKRVDVQQGKSQVKIFLELHCHQHYLNE